MNWQPTCELRWVNYSPKTLIDSPSANGKVLQQKWVATGAANNGEVEWRDVPVGEEA